jgi:hypothetical protein
VEEVFRITDKITDSVVATLSERYDATEAGVLANVRFGTHSGEPTVPDGAVEFPIHMTRHREHEFTETWAASGPVTTGKYEELVYAQDGERLFCAFHIPASDGYARQVEKAYGHIFEIIEELGFPELFRMWNYIGSINGSNGAGMETYRDFCFGRAGAFARYGKGMPAATGVGALSGGIGCYALSGRVGSAVHIENPQQIPAYRYPDRYGPRPPSFARATYLLPSEFNGRRQRLFVSGTASIIGHESQHAGDIAAQCDVALNNIKQLISSPNLARHDVHIERDDLSFDAVKVYVRRLADIPLVASKCARYFDDPATRIGYLNVGICRSELLVEIEAIASVRGQDAHAVE